MVDRAKERPMATSPRPIPRPVAQAGSVSTSPRPPERPMTSSPIPPANPAQAVPNSATAPCCWCTSHTKDVSGHGSTYVLSTQHPNHAIKFRLRVDFVANEVVISRVLKWGTVDPTVTAAERETIKNALTTATPTVLSNQFSLKVTDSSCSPADKILPIRFKLVWERLHTPADLTVNLYPSTYWANANGTEINLATTDAGPGLSVLPHEFLHTVGQVDEYLYTTGTTASAAYHRANGPSQTVAIPQTNIMGTDSNFTLLPRFFWFVEIEAQQLLRSASGLGKAAIICEIV